MTHLTVPNLIKTCEVASLNAPFRAMMGAIGASEGLAFHWRTQSIAAEKAGEKNIFYFEWRQGQWGWWHNKIVQARIDFYEGYASELSYECRFGREEVVLGPTQEVVYRTDPALLEVSDEDLDRLYNRKSRYLLDPETGLPVPLTKTIFPPPAIRLRILEQLKRFRAAQDIDVNVSGNVVHSPAPLQRRVGEERPDIAALRALAKIPPKHPFPLDAHGHRTIPRLGAPRGDDRSDHVREQQPTPPPVNPRMYEAAPPNPPAPAQPRPDYAKRAPSHIGRGVIPPNGFKMS